MHTIAPQLLAATSQRRNSVSVHLRLDDGRTFDNVPMAALRRITE